MTHLISTERFIVNSVTSESQGTVRFLTAKTLWLAVHGVLGLIGVVWFFSMTSVAVFFALTAITICAGHSVGMHRLLIHRSFETHQSVEYLLVWLGTLVGMAGPVGMIRLHDQRDWHQRQINCPAYPAHDAPIGKDAYWQLCCEFRLKNPPDFRLENRVANDLFYRWLEKTWKWQQLPVGIILFSLGGFSMVFWGISLRIFVSLVGHWAVGHFAHRRGHQGWAVKGIPVQGYNLVGLGLITFGENWHGNHHAFPHSAKLGLEKGQLDPGFVLISAMAQVGLAWNIKLPSSETERDGLIRL